MPSQYGCFSKSSLFVVLCYFPSPTANRIQRKKQSTRPAIHFRLSLSRVCYSATRVSHSNWLAVWKTKADVVLLTYAVFKTSTSVTWQDIRSDIGKDTGLDTWNRNSRLVPSSCVWSRHLFPCSIKVSSAGWSVFIHRLGNARVVPSTMMCPYASVIHNTFV